jgi:hypothetical protein
MKRFSISTFAVLALGAAALTLGACEEGSGDEGNPITDQNTVQAPQDDPAISLDGGTK